MSLPHTEFEAILETLPSPHTHKTEYSSVIECFCLVCTRPWVLFPSHIDTNKQLLSLFRDITIVWIMIWGEGRAKQMSGNMYWALSCSCAIYLERYLNSYFVTHCSSMIESALQGSKSLVIGERLNIRFLHRHGLWKWLIHTRPSHCVFLSVYYTIL